MCGESHTPEPSTQNAPPPVPAAVSHIGERPGDWIGPYKLMEVIGEGGFGTVWLAERREPMVQRVALKVIKPGMDSKAVIARFEQERQALAVMDHPNVAKVLDGGVTPSGRPYFVMEHVKGESITTFADRHRLTIKQRLELFIPVCEAVQHAHMKGIIHRDLKPGNILVAPTGEQGGSDAAATHGMLVKVIDFGVAKAISHTLTEKTIFTERGQIIGTPEYMSPEQAEMGATDIDTRTDVYSLGVVLYELLSGTLPFDPKTLRAAGYGEIQRIIREVDAPRPSTKLSTADDETGAEIARARQADRENIAGELRRELEWIPLKALRKDRARRYKSAESLGADVRRYLDDRPLEAGPEGMGYRLRKLIGRNKGLVAAAASVLVLLLAACSALAIAWVQTDRSLRAQESFVFEAGMRQLATDVPNGLNRDQWRRRVLEILEFLDSSPFLNRRRSDPSAEYELVLMHSSQSWAAKSYLEEAEWASWEAMGERWLLRLQKEAGQRPDALLANPKFSDITLRQAEVNALCEVAREDPLPTSQRQSRARQRLQDLVGDDTSRIGPSGRQTTLALLNLHAMNVEFKQGTPLRTDEVLEVLRRATASECSGLANDPFSAHETLEKMLGVYSALQEGATVECRQSAIDMMSQVAAMAVQEEASCFGDWQPPRTDVRLDLKNTVAECQLLVEQVRVFRRSLSPAARAAKLDCAKRFALNMLEAYQRRMARDSFDRVFWDEKHSDQPSKAVLDAASDAYWSLNDSLPADMRAAQSAEPSQSPE